MYTINESTAKLANDMNSFSTYTAGRATSEYAGMVNEARAIAEHQKQRVDPMYHEKIDYLLDLYERKLADNLNSRNAIDTRCPSWLVSGGSNFPTGKKEKQNAARDKNSAEYYAIQGLLDKIRSTGTGGIQSGDPNATAKLTAKLESLEKSQELMKTVNAYYRKHGTVSGCPIISETTAQKIVGEMAQSWHTAKVPYASWALSNNNAEIHRIRDRIATLQKAAEAEPVDREAAEGIRYSENTEIMRVQLIFDCKPSEAVRAVLKSRGFRWAPSQSAWQRDLNDNGKYAAKKALEEIAAI